jgi:hypothetical protein
MSRLPPGTEVGAERWPLRGAHPRAWGRPWKGTVLSPEDPRGWRDTLAFPRGEPDPTVMSDLVARNPHLGVKYVAVLWEFGKVYWERADALRPCAEDLAAWEAAREAALSNASRLSEGRPRAAQARAA